MCRRVVRCWYAVVADAEEPGVAAVEDRALQKIPESYEGTTCEGYYDVHGDRVDFTTVTTYTFGECAPLTWYASWRETDDGLAMDVVTDGDELNFLFGAKPWERID